MVSVRGKILSDFSIANELVNPDNHKLPAGVNRKIEFRCLFGHIYSIQPVKRINRGTGCQKCKLQKNNFLTNIKDLEYRERIQSEWIDKRNQGIKITEITKGSEIRHWWKCSSCQHEYQQHAYHRSRRVGCPKCAGKILHDDNNLLASFPIMEKFWSDKNELGPNNYFPFTNKTFLFVCSRDQTHEYERSISIVTQEINRLLSINPSLTDKEYIDQISCSICSNKIVTRVNSVGYLCPELIKYWNSDMNTKSIFEISPGAEYYASWQCPDCRHTWEAFVFNRTRSVFDCPHCVRKPKYWQFKQNEIENALRDFMIYSHRLPKIKETIGIARLYTAIQQNHNHFHLNTANYWFEFLLRIIVGMNDEDLKAVLEIDLENRLSRYTKKNNRVSFDYLLNIIDQTK